MDEIKSTRYNEDNPLHRDICMYSIELLSKGFYGSHLHKKIAKKFNIAESYAKNIFVPVARKKLKINSKEFIKDAIDNMNEMYMEIYRKSREKGDLKTCATILKNMEGLNSLSTIKTENKNDIVITF